MMDRGLILANDVAYHMDKVNRNYKNLDNILGADHTGYIKSNYSSRYQLYLKKE
jgi:arginyl-tRNA synthetase